MGLLDLFRGGVRSVGADQARELVRGNAVLVDVREQAEWNAGHAPQAVHIPLSRVGEAERRLRRDRQVVVVCRSGNRSRTAARRLVAMGFDAVSLSGGMRAWQAAGGPVLDRKNRPGAVV